MLKIILNLLKNQQEKQQDVEDQKPLENNKYDKEGLPLNRHEDKVWLMCLGMFYQDCLQRASTGELDGDVLAKHLTDGLWENYTDIYYLKLTERIDKELIKIILDFGESDVMREFNQAIAETNKDGIPSFNQLKITTQQQ